MCLDLPPCSSLDALALLYSQQGRYEEAEPLFVEALEKKRGLLGYTPIGLVTSTAGNLAGLRTRLKDAKIEGEVVDSVTGEVLSIFRVDDIGNWDEKKALSWEDLSGTLQSALARVIGATGW